MNISYLCEKCFIWTSPCFLLGSVLFIFLVVCVVLLCFFTFLVPCCEDRYALRITTMFGSSLPAVVCRRANVLFTLFVFDCAQWFPTHIVLCFFFVCLRLVFCVWWCPTHIVLSFVLFVFVLCSLCFQFLWIVHF